MSEDSTRSVSDGDAFDLLSNARRRFVLGRLQEVEDGIPLTELAVELSAIENDVPAAELSEKERKRTYVSLYQTHVPKLEAAGIVTYDDSGVLRRTERIGELAAYFEPDPEPDGFRRRYLAICAGGLALYAITVAADLPAVRPVQVGLAVLVAIATLSLARYVYTQWLARGTAVIPVERERADSP